jgi:hypothetical protein
LIDHFLEFLHEKDKNISQKYLSLTDNDSQILIEVAKHLEKFLEDLFPIVFENLSLQKKHQDLQVIYKARLNYVQRQISKKYSAEDFALFKNLDAQKFRCCQNLNKRNLFYLLKQD